ncbi:MAG: efflux RND transporter permease subunit [Chloroflexota bacterium]|nr:MAG: efflux RND transporter permease subunit [Chloroflexota bacterium]
MIRGIIKQSIKLRYLVIILAVVLMFFGVYQLSEMPVDVYPEFNPPIVEVQTEALGLSATEVEALLTVPMEADLLNGVAWLERIYSNSVNGLSSIIMIFEPGTDPIKARQMVQERLTQTYALPNVSLPPVMMQPLSTTSRAMMVSLSSEDLSLIDLGVLARWVIAPRLMGVPGVANVATWGLREWQLQVLVSPEDLQEKGVTLNQVISTTGEAMWVSPLSYLESSKPGTSGWIDTPNQRLSILHRFPISSAEELSKIPVKGTAYTLGDVSEVVEDHQPLIGDAVLNDGNPGLLMVIEKFPNANTLEVTKGVEEALEAMAPGLSGVNIDTTVFRPANYIELATGNLSTVLLVGAGLLLLVLFILYWDWRPTLVSLIAIPASLIIALLVLYLFGSTINVMLLAGMVVALTIIVDDAIIDPEYIQRRFRSQEKDLDSDEKEDLIANASAEMRGSIISAFLIMLLVLLPVFLIQGVTGRFFQPFAIAYAVAMLLSIIVALTLTPSLSMVLLRNHERRESPVIGFLGRVYSGIVSGVIRVPRLTYVVAGVIVVVSLVAIPFLNVSLLPTFKQTDIRIQWDAAPGTSQPEMNRIVAQATNELQAIPGVSNVGAHVGRAITGDQLTGINSGEIWISIDPAADYDATMVTVNEVVNGFPGLIRKVDTYQPDRLGQIVSGESDKDMVIRVYGWDFDILESKAEEIQAGLVSVDGLRDVEVEYLEVEPQVEIEVDLAAAERYQVKPGDVRRSATTLLSGLRVGNLYEEQKVFDVMVWGEEEVRRNLTDIKNLLIDTPGGGHVRLGEVADVRISPTPINIKRDAVSRYIDVTANLEGRSYGAVVADVENVVAGVDVPLEYHVELLGDFAQRQANMQQTLIIAGVAVFGIILLLQATFWSWQIALSIFFIVLASLSGGLLTAFIAGGEVTLGSLFGFLVILGLSMRFNMVMVKHMQHLEEEGEEFGPDLVVRGAVERMKPVLITAIGLGVAFLPILFKGADPGLEILHPMVVISFGGLITSTLFSLFVMPAIYLRYGMHREAESSHKIETHTFATDSQS